MKKTTWILGFLLAAALPAVAQNNEFGFAIGDAKAMKTPAGKSSWDSGVRELYYGFQLDPTTIFKIKVGEMTATTSFPIKDANGKVTGYDSDPKGQIQHADGIIEYRFAEPYGYTGLFAGGGLYRERAANNHSTSNYGFQGGLNGIFPLTRSLSLTAEAAYHWVHFYSPKPRYVTLTVGVRLAF